MAIHGLIPKDRTTGAARIYYILYQQGSSRTARMRSSSVGCA